MAGKKYNDALAKIDRAKLYSPAEALELVLETATASFDETIEIHFRLGIDPRQAEQQLRGTLMLPAGTGQEIRVAVFAEGEAARIAEEAGADMIMDDQEIEKIQQGEINFDTAIAVPEMMGKVGRLGRVLGPRGLMPNPKSGTVVPADDLPRVIEEMKAGRIEYRNDRYGNVHTILGKASFSQADLARNFESVVEEIRRQRPASAKGQYIRKMVITSTMGPGIKVDPQAAIERVTEDDDE